VRGDPFPPLAGQDLLDGSPRWEGLADALDAWVEQGRAVGGEIHVIQSRRTVLHHCAGWRDRESGDPWLPGTLCDVRSMAKPVLATAALALAEDGVLSLADPAARFLPSFAGGTSRGITVEQLLHHTAGLDHPGFPASLRSYPDLRAAADDVGRQGPAAPPGSRFRYSDAGSAVLGAVVAAAAGEPVEAFIQRRLLEPLGMSETFVRIPRSLEHRVASAYKPREERFVRYWKPDDPPKLHFYVAAGGLTSTTTDYARFLAAWMDGGRTRSGRLLRGHTVSAALRSVPLTRLPDERGNHGMQWWLYSDPADGEGIQLVFGSDGSDGTWAMAAPGLDLMVLYFTQTRDGTTVFDAMGLVRELLERHSGVG
jgi:CubicO group peptidase (beta-lactamase class C family)